MNSEWVAKTEKFLLAKFDGGEYLSGKPRAKAYRLEHTYRVANIGREIARGEDFDETETVIACLLHDVSYCEEFGEEGWINHGRRAAKIARPFLESLGMAPDRISDICYGIAIHVDDRADFDGERTAFALSVSDADNIDRFDAYRIHETLCHVGFLDMSFDEKVKFASEQLSRLRKMEKMELATPTASRLWRERIALSVSFYERLTSQLYNSAEIK